MNQQQPESQDDSLEYAINPMPDLTYLYLHNNLSSVPYEHLPPQTVESHHNAPNEPRHLETPAQLNAQECVLTEFNGSSVRIFNPPKAPTASYEYESSARYNSNGTWVQSPCSSIGEELPRTVEEINASVLTPETASPTHSEAVNQRRGLATSGSRGYFSDSRGSTSVSVTSHSKDTAARSRDCTVPKEAPANRMDVRRRATGVAVGNSVCSGNTAESYGCEVYARLRGNDSHFRRVKPGYRCCRELLVEILAEPRYEHYLCGQAFRFEGLDKATDRQLNMQDIIESDVIIVID